MQDIMNWFSNDIIQHFNQTSSNGQPRQNRMIFQPVRPPYKLIDDHYAAREALMETYSHCSYLLLYGYSGSGKSTILQQMAVAMPENVFYFSQSSQQSPSSLLGKIGERLGLSVKQRVSEIEPVVEALKLAGRKILIFDDIVLDSDIDNFKRVNMITSLYDATGHPVVICGTKALKQRLFNDHFLEKYDHIRSRLICAEVKGMTFSDAQAYLQMIQDEENIFFSVPARQQLSKIATNPSHSGIRKFTMMIGRITSNARRNYYSMPDHTIPDEVKCIDKVMTPGIDEPVPTSICILPKTPELLYISDEIVQDEITRCVASISKRPHKKRATQTATDEDPS